MLTKKYLQMKILKISSKNIYNIIPSDNSNLKRILLKIFPDKKYLLRIVMISLKQFSYPDLLKLKEYFLCIHYLFSRKK